VKNVLGNVITAISPRARTLVEMTTQHNSNTTSDSNTGTIGNTFANASSIANNVVNTVATTVANTVGNSPSTTAVNDFGNTPTNTAANVSMDAIAIPDLQIAVDLDNESPAKAFFAE